MSDNKTKLQLLNILLEQAIERGFGIYGICHLIIKLHSNCFFNNRDKAIVEMIINDNKPRFTDNSGYWWPIGEEHKHKRIDFIKNVIENEKG